MSTVSNVLGSRTAAEVNARVRELAGKAYDAADPTPDPPVYALSALATAFALFCKVKGLSWDQSLLAFQTAWQHSGEPLQPSAASPPSSAPLPKASE